MLCDTLIRHKELRAGYIGFEKIQAKIAQAGWAIHQRECPPHLCATAAHQGEQTDRGDLLVTTKVAARRTRSAASAGSRSY
jgi:hypothetical protein